jgi:hypothetical protein
MMHTEMKAFVMDKGRTKKLESSSGTHTTTSLTYEEMRDEAVRSVNVVFPLSECDPACLAAQLDSYHVNDLGMDPKQDLRADKCGRSSKEVANAKKFAEAREAKLRASAASS